MRARELMPDGSYRRVQPAEGESPYRCQQALLAIRESASAMPGPPANGQPAVSSHETTATT
jgi:hypothetical protein